MAGQQLDLFSVDTVSVAAGTARAAPSMHAVELPDDELIAALPNAGLATASSLAAEAGRRRPRQSADQATGADELRDVETVSVMGVPQRATDERGWRGMIRRIAFVVVSALAGMALFIRGGEPNGADLIEGFVIGAATVRVTPGINATTLAAVLRAVKAAI